MESEVSMLSVLEKERLDAMSLEEVTYIVTMAPAQMLEFELQRRRIAKDTALREITKIMEGVQADD